MTALPVLSVFLALATAVASASGPAHPPESPVPFCAPYPSEDFDTASAWVTGVRWARGANKDRTTPPPTFNVRFRLADGTLREYCLGPVEFKDRFFMHRRFTAEERKALAGAALDAFFFKGLTDEDAGVTFEDGRVYRERFEKFEGFEGFEKFEGVCEGDVVPAASAAAAPCALVPQFNGGSVDPLTEDVLEKSVRREGRCLIVDLRAPAGAVKAVSLGSACETSVVRRVRVPYLTYGDVDELAGGYFRYAFFDWYRSNASRIALRKVNGVETMVAEYRPKTDGTYNPVRERIVIALSDEFADVLPEIPNPPSKFKALTGSLVWRSHASCDRARDKAFWQTLHDAGIRKMAVMDHETMWRDGGESFTFVTEAAKGKGGDAAQRDYTRFMIDTLGYVYGPYNNYTDYAPNNAKWWNIDRVSRNPDGSLAPAWMRCYAPKPTAILPMCEQIVPEAQAKFGFTGAYCDVHTAFAPWERTDYDARCPGAATFAQTYFAYGKLLLRQKELWEGPVWSEGGYHFMYAGLSDGNYARDGRFRFYDDPWLVDFDLRKIHPLENDFGMGSLGHFSPGKTDLERQYYLPHAPDGIGTLVDLFIGATLAFGHTGYLVADWMFDPPKMFGLAYCGGGRETFDRGLGIARKSYFMTQAIAARYSRETVEDIRYFDANGAALGTSAAIRQDAVRRRQIYVRYTGGVHVLVNGNKAERLRATIGGKTYDLPPCGYRAWTDDGAVEIESGDANGTGPRRDRAHAPEYDYDERNTDEGQVRLEGGRVEVVVAPQAGDVTRYAADELARYLGESLGAEIPVRTQPTEGQVSLIVGTNGWSRAAGVCPEALPRDGYVVKVEPGRIYLAGCDDASAGAMAALLRSTSQWPFLHGERASVFAVYGFLERFVGARFYFPGELGRVVPRRRAVTIACGTWRRMPDFTVREPSFTDPDTYLHLGTQSKYTPCGHGLSGVVSMRRFGATHPEYFVLTKGPDGTKVREPSLGKKLDPRHAGHLCYSNPALLDQIHDDAVAYFAGVSAEKHGVPSIYSAGKWSWNHGCWYGEYFDLMGQDGFKPCLCDACQAEYSKTDEAQYATEFVWKTTARIAQRFLDEGRAGTFTQMAYPPYRHIPSCDIPTNVLVMVSEYGPWSVGNPTLFKRDTDEVKAWAKKLGRKVWLWTYPGKLGSRDLAGVPQMSPHAHGNYFKTLAPYIFGMKTESETDKKIYNYLNDYVAQRVAWDNGTDVDAVIEEHHRLMFGAAATEMAAFYRLLEEKWVNEIACNVADTPVGPVASVPSVQEIWTRVYSPAFVDGCEALFAKATAKLPAGTVEARRVEYVRSEFLEPLAVQSRRLAAGFNVSAEQLRRAANPGVPNVLGDDGETQWHAWPGTNKTVVADCCVTPPTAIRVVSQDRTYVTHPLKGLLETNATYRISLYARGEGIAPFSTYDGGLNVEISDGVRKWRYPYANGNNGVGFFGTFGWIHLSFTFTAGPKIGETPYLSVRLANCTGAAWFDAPRLERVR